MSPPGERAGHDRAGDSEQQGAAGEGGAGARHQAEEGQAADGPGARGRHAEPPGGAGLGQVLESPLSWTSQIGTTVTAVFRANRISGAPRGDPTDSNEGQWVCDFLVTCRPSAGSWQRRWREAN